MKCDACDGCGKVTNTQEREPWSAWTSLPLISRAVLAGIVRPIQCNQCEGTGKMESGDSKTKGEN